MSLLERDTVMVSTDEEGNALVDLPFTRVNNVEGIGRSANTYYSVGNVVYTDSNLSVALKCTTAGTTSNTELDISGRAVGESVEDGSVVWKVIGRSNVLDEVDVLPIANGGTGASNASGARTNLGLNTAITGASISGKIITLKFADNSTKTLTVLSDMSDYIVESYRNGTEWYEVYKSGKVRQGGRYQHTSATGYATISLLKSFANTNYSVSIQKGCPTADNFFTSNAPSARNWQASMYTNTSFKTFMSKKGTGEDSLAYCVWVAEGQGA